MKGVEFMKDCVVRCQLHVYNEEASDHGVLFCQLQQRGFANLTSFAMQYCLSPIVHALDHYLVSDVSTNNALVTLI